MILEYIKFFWWVLLIIIHLLGIIAALDVIMKGRTAQGSIAWAVSLLFIPYFAIPLYLMFGSRKFSGYVNARRTGDLEIHHIAEKLKQELASYKVDFIEKETKHKVLEQLAKMPFTNCNTAELLINGDDTFEAIFEGIEKARDYILVQFYTVHDDELGKKLKDRLIAKVKEGIRIYFLYDEVGCRLLSDEYVEELSEQGINIVHFKTNRRWNTRLQLNFRNHRKIVIVDGKEAYVGGLNVSRRYLSMDERFGFWRDTHVKIKGPAVLCVQIPFIADWYWFFVHCINSARKFVWISSPYFVPDQQILAALQLAALRGVDVRILIPEKTDNILVNYSAYSFLKDVMQVGIKVYRYQKGFLHQKVILVDDGFAAVGTANLDNRSFRINFEIMMCFTSGEFTNQTHEMLKNDLQDSRLITMEDIEKKPFWFKIAARISRLMAPLQ
jgi:cardiolipin synthase